MGELYIEGVAIHDGPESCVAVREDGDEALTGVLVGRVIEPRNHLVRGADAVSRGGRPYRRSRYRERPTNPARSEILCMRGTSMRENREIPWSPARLITGRAVQGRPRPYA